MNQPQYSESRRDSRAQDATAPASIAGAAVITDHGPLRLCLMLLALHAALAWDVGTGWARAFLLAHFGLFLLWQPVWAGERAIEPRHALLVVAAGVALAASNGWWLIAVWLAVLVGLIGGSVPGFADRRSRIASILAAVYLLALLLVWVVPQLPAGTAVATVQREFVRYGLPFLVLGIAFTRAGLGRGTAPVVLDLFYSLLVFLLVLVLVLGSLLVKHVSGSNYAWALAQTLVVIGALLLALSWLWNPRGGYAGLGQMLSRYLLSVGLPFERWMQDLADLAHAESQPERFLEAALQRMQKMPWVTGIEWRSAAASGALGDKSGHRSEFPGREVALRVYTRWRPSPAILLHMRLLAQMVEYFYQAKLREEIQRQNAYAQAIHETGARLTHDVKNLLQSLHALCAAAETGEPQQAAALQALMQRQLPQIAQRLTATLEKLRAPGVVAASPVHAPSWWDGLVQRYGARDIQFRFEGDRGVSAPALPAELFDSVADNLIENALAKRAAAPHARISVTFAPEDGERLLVCDTGEPIDAAIAPRLMMAPVTSRSGLGVGLYHAARQAAQSGYALRVVANEHGRVCFELARAPAAGATAAGLPPPCG